MTSPNQDSPLRIYSSDHEVVRSLSVLYDESKGRFLGRVVSFYIEKNKEEIEGKKEEFFVRMDQALLGLASELTSP